MNLQPRKSLESCLPDGQVVDRAWLKLRGFDRPRVDSFVRSGALQAQFGAGQGSEVQTTDEQRKQVSHETSGWSPARKVASAFAH